MNLETKKSEQKLISDAVEGWHKNSNFTFQTSGSTGTPKPISFTKDQVIASVLQTQKAFGLTDADVVLLSLPMKYVAGQIMLYRALHLNMDLRTVEPRIDLSEAFKYNVSFAAFIPPQVENMLKDEQGQKWLSSIRVVLIGGGPIGFGLAEELKSFSNDIYHTYGMTETLTHVAVKRLSRGGSSFFAPLPNIELTEVEGVLSIEARHLNVSISTNDIVRLNGDQTFEILGRKDNVINSGGLKIHPEKLETIFRKYLQKELIVKGVNDDNLGEKVVLFIESEKKIDPEWMNLAMSEIDKPKRPKLIQYLAEFPRTESGKIKRNEIFLN